MSGEDDIFMYGIVLDRTGGDRLGINLSSPDGDVVVINGIAADGLVGMWNRVWAATKLCRVFMVSWVVSGFARCFAVAPEEAD